MPDVSLSGIPDKGTDLEHYVAALFQSAGYFVEKNITERAPGDVLELDVVASSYSASQRSHATLVEIKGGKWGWKDAFYLLGRKTYLGLPKAVLFGTLGTERPVDTMCSKLAPQGVDVVQLDDFEQSQTVFHERGLGQPSSDLDLWRYSYWIERQLVGLINETNDLDTCDSRSVVRDRHRLVNDQAFFTSDPIEQAHGLYEAYREQPSLTGAWAQKMDECAASSACTSERGSLHRALFAGTEPLLQASMYVEHRARLALLKFAVDCLLSDAEEVTDERPAAGQLIRRAQLPLSFTNGLSWLRAQPTYWRYPVLWQQFLWGYGGFYLDHCKEEEFGWMAEYSGVPVDEIPVALETFDRLFPTSSGSWLKAIGTTNIVLVKMTPSYFQGLGAFWRLAQNDIERFESLGGSSETARHFKTRTENTYRFLSGEPGK